MSLQLIVRCERVSDVEAMLAPVTARVEVFAIDNDYVGISIPAAELDSVGEEVIRNALSHVNAYDLYAGAWSKA